MMTPIAILAALQSAPDTASPRFVDRSAEMGIAPAGGHAAWGDANADGWSDLWAGGVLWLNREGKDWPHPSHPAPVQVAELNALCALWLPPTKGDPPARLSSSA